MAPKYRQLHTKTLDSFDFNEMEDDFARVCWLLLPLILDSAGRGILNSAWIRSKMFPLRQDVSLEDIDNAFSWFIWKRMIVDYEVNGRKYFYIPTWHDYQSGTDREALSLLPAPQMNKDDQELNDIEQLKSITQELVESNTDFNQELVSSSPPYAESASATESVSESVSESEKPARKQKILSERPEVYSIYESNIGLLTPIIAEDLDDAVNMYSFEWVRDAIQEAVRNEKRNYKYALAILKRWKREGRNTPKASTVFNPYAGAIRYD